MIFSLPKLFAAGGLVLLTALGAAAWVYGAGKNAERAVCLELLTSAQKLAAAERRALEVQLDDRFREIERTTPGGDVFLDRLRKQGASTRDGPATPFDYPERYNKDD